VPDPGALLRGVGRCGTGQEPGGPSNDHLAVGADVGNGPGPRPRRDQWPGQRPPSRPRRNRRPGATSTPEPGGEDAVIVAPPTGPTGDLGGESTLDGANCPWFIWRWPARCKRKLTFRSCPVAGACQKGLPCHDVSCQSGGPACHLHGMEHACAVARAGIGPVHQTPDRHLDLRKGRRASSGSRAAGRALPIR
jgi:hypothetical protein